ncbi:MAG: HVO_0476 family zinc finger protein [Thermoplasmata archaeon]|nr:HVO_0476 family zinc finger protein [Thermoplasmata archaeon]
MKQIPQSMTLECPECDGETLHKTLKGRYEGKRLKLVLKCSKCDNIRNEIIESVGQISVRMIVSRSDVSEKTTAQFPADWDMTVGDEFMHEDERLQVSGIEVAGARVEGANVKEIKTLWTKNFDQARVRISINRHGRTRSLEMLTDLEEVFTIESEIDVDGMPVKIHSIKTKNNHVRRGTVAARDVVRIYCTDTRPMRSYFRKR